MARVLVVEDHSPIATMVRSNLEFDGHEVRIAGDGRLGLSAVTAWSPDLVILDLMLPHMDGFEVLRRMRAQGATGRVMVLSARGGEAEKVRALRSGADDYLVKPFGVLELMARADALLRRGGLEGLALDPPRFCFDGVEVYPAERVVRRDGAIVPLRPREFDLLLALLRAGGAVVSRKELLSRIWGYDAHVVTRTVDTHIAMLRARLEQNPEHPRHILTVWKAGYRIASSMQR